MGKPAVHKYLDPGSPIVKQALMVSRFETH